jgi:hypothetical protein
VYKTVSKSVEEMNLPVIRENNMDLSVEPTQSLSPNYIPRLVDQTIRFPITKSSSSYTKVKEIIKTHMEYSSLELDFHKLNLVKDHIEAAIYYLRNIEL